MQDLVPRWVRLGLLVTLALPQLVIGSWAVFAPASFFRSFPGFDPRLVAAVPPYNEHLVTDVGAGFLATGAALVAAAAWAHRLAVYTALIAYVAFTLPHVLYHALNPAAALSGVEDAANALTLGSGLILAAAFAIGSGPRRRPAAEPRAPAEMAATT
jgi:hypothetical protein